MTQSSARHSAIYEGTVRHRRFWPKDNHFRYPIYLLYLDLEEVPDLFDGRWLWSLERRNVVSFQRRDYLGDPKRPIDICVRELVEEHTGMRPTGPIRMLTHLRLFGFQMNPATFYYCFDASGTVEFLVVEVTNTPWDERHSYVLSRDQTHPKVELWTAEHPKIFHVSPFMDLGMDYRWRFAQPAERLFVHVDLLVPDDDPLADDPERPRPSVPEPYPSGPDHSEKIFDATLDLDRRPLDSATMARVLLRHPWMTARVAFWIYAQAARLWLRKIPFIPHPKIRGLAPAGHPDLVNPAERDAAGG